MPPSSAKAKAKAQKDRTQSRSRNTTPVSTTSASVIIEPKSESSRRSMERSTSPYLSTSLDHPQVRATRLSNTAISDVFENASSTVSGIPSASSLNTIFDTIKGNILSIVRSRDEACDQMMRELATRKKERVERDRQREIEEAAKLREEERRKQLKKTSTPKEKERPLAVGAHGVARQDGGDRMDTSSPISSIASHPPPSNTDAAIKQEKGSGSDSEEEPHQPPPAATIPVYQIFGEDPSSFPDPTIYEVLPITPDMPEDEKKKIFGVAEYPPSDLRNLTAGTPPDRDFSTAKPSNQVAAQTFLNFVEPYLRPLTQEDRSFLLERGDRIHVFEVPKRGTRHYKETWAEEDGTFLFDNSSLNLPANEGRGSIEMMGDDMLDTELVSVGPATSRWLSLLRPVTRTAQDESPTTNGAPRGDEMDIDNPEPTQNGTEGPKPDVPVAAAFPETTWKNVAHPMAPADYPSLDTRLIEELRHVGFLPPSETPTYADVQDDEVTARLRYLQRELRRVSLLNGARKARIYEITEDRMAKQEWQGISDDLDSQLNQAYLKRTRNIGKGKKQVKRPLGAPVAGVARPIGSSGIGEPIKSLMERRHMWNELIGPVVDHGKVEIPKDTIFDSKAIERLVKAEQDNWVEDGDDI